MVSLRLVSGQSQALVSLRSVLDLSQVCLWSVSGQCQGLEALLTHFVVQLEPKILLEHN